MKDQFLDQVERWIAADPLSAACALNAVSGSKIVVLEGPDMEAWRVVRQAAREAVVLRLQIEGAEQRLLAAARNVK